MENNERKDDTLGLPKLPAEVKTYKYFVWCEPDCASHRGARYKRYLEKPSEAIDLENSDVVYRLCRFFSLSLDTSGREGPWHNDLGTVLGVWVDEHIDFILENYEKSFSLAAGVVIGRETV